jgi:hypothetical protein
MRLRSEFRGLGLHGCARVPNRGKPKPAVIHGFARRLLVFKLPDQLTICFTQSTGYIRFSAPANSAGRLGSLVRNVMRCSLPPRSCQGDIYPDHADPTSQMGPERRQRIQYERTLLRYETRAHADHVFIKDDSLFVVRLARRGLVSGDLISAH